MKRQVIVLGITLIGAGFVWAQGDTHADLQRLAGSWSLQLQEAGGKAVPEKERAIPKMKLVVNGSNYAVYFDDDKLGTGTFRMDAIKEPRTIDFTHGDGVDKGKVESGIYRFKGDDFEIVYAGLGQPRPTEFRTRPNTKEMRILYKRIGK